MISVVTIVRNDLYGLMRTRRSLESQNFCDWEHIIVPSARSEASYLYARDLEQSRTILHVQQGCGIYNAMNEGLSVASEDFVIFLNAGDLFVNRASLGLVANHLFEKDSDWFVFGGYSVGAFRTTHVSPIARPDAWSIGRGASGIMHPSVCYRRSFLLDLGGYSEDFVIAGDLDLNVRASLRASPRVIAIPTSIFFQDGISSKKVFSSISEARRVRAGLLYADLYIAFGDTIWFGFQLIKVGIAKFLRFRRSMRKTAERNLHWTDLSKSENMVALPTGEN